jgi:hypothetical protein
MTRYAKLKRLTKRPLVEIRAFLPKCSRERSTAQHSLLFFGGKNGSQELSEPSFDIAGGGNELILEIHLCESFVAGASQAVAAH